MNVNAEEFKKRLPADAVAERQFVDSMFRFPEAVAKLKESVLADRRLSPEGKADELRRRVLGDGKIGIVPHMKTELAKLEQWQSYVDSGRATMTPKAPARDDIVGHLQQRELRDLLRSLPPSERTKLVLEDSAFGVAAITAHPKLSGISPEVHQHAIDAEMQRQFGDRIHELNAREKVVNEVKAVAEIVKSTLVKEAGLQPEDLE